MDLMGQQLQSSGGNVTLEPRTLNPLAVRTRPDIVAQFEDYTSVGDLTMRYPGAISCLPSAATKPLHAALQGEKKKDDAWANWAERHNAFWAPLAMETTGAMAPRMIAWLRQACSSNDGPLTITTSFDAIVAAVQIACFEGTADLYASARGDVLPPNKNKPSRMALNPQNNNPFFAPTKIGAAPPSKPLGGQCGTDGQTAQKESVRAEGLSSTLGGRVFFEGWASQPQSEQ